MTRVIVLSFLLISQIALSSKIAFIGDSLSTGGAAHPEMSLDAKSFKDLLTGDINLAPDQSYFTTIKEQGFSFAEASPPIRLDRSYREYQHPFFWFVDSLWVSFGVQYLDAEQYSWPYLLSRDLGYQPQDILIAARDGERMSSGVRQVDRLLDYTKGVLPKDVFVFFSGNDLCGPSMDYVTTSESYQEDLSELLRYLKLNGKPSPQGTTVHVLNPLGILQIVTSSSILKKNVPFQGKTYSCKQIQTLKPEDLQNTPQEETGDPMDLFIGLVAAAPSNYCSTLFSLHKGNTEQQIALSNRLNSYRKGIEKAVKEFNELAGTDIIAHHVEETSELLFEGDDIANDCFHLALSGHGKLAKLVKKSLENKKDLR